MSESWRSVKFLSTDDTNFPAEVDSETHALIYEGSYPLNKQSTEDGANNSHGLTSEQEVMQCLEADSGLYSKFKNTRVIEEYSIYEPRGFEERYSFISNTGFHKADTSYISELSLSKEYDKERDGRKGPTTGFTLSILLTVFTMEFGNFLGRNALNDKNSWCARDCIYHSVLSQGKAK